MAASLKLTNLSWVGLGKEPTQGTVVNPTLWVPVKASSLKPEDVYNYVNDDSLQNNPAKVRGVYQGEADSTLAMDGLLFPDHIGTFLVAAGLSDVVTGSSAPYTHTFKYNSASSQPSWTATVYNVVETRRYPGLVLSDFGLKVDAKGAISYTSKWVGWPSSVSSSPAWNGPSDASLLGYEAAVSIGGVSVARVKSIDWQIKREATAEHTLQGTQSPYETFQGPMDGTMKLKLTFENTTDFAHLTSNDQPAVVLTITVPGGGSNPVLTMTATATGWKKAAHDFSGKHMQLDVDIQNMWSSTDGAPLQVTLANAVASAY